MDISFIEFYFRKHSKRSVALTTPKSYFYQIPSPDSFFEMTLAKDLSSLKLESMNASQTLTQEFKFGPDLRSKIIMDGQNYESLGSILIRIVTNLDTFSEWGFTSLNSANKVIKNDPKAFFEREIGRLAPTKKYLLYNFPHSQKPTFLPSTGIDVTFGISSAPSGADWMYTYLLNIPGENLSKEWVGHSVRVFEFIGWLAHSLPGESYSNWPNSSRKVYGAPPEAPPEKEILNPDELLGYLKNTKGTRLSESLVDIMTNVNFRFAVLISELSKKGEGPESLSMNLIKKIINSTDKKLVITREEYEYVKQSLLFREFVGLPTCEADGTCFVFW